MGKLALIMIIIIVILIIYTIWDIEEFQSYLNSQVKKNDWLIEKSKMDYRMKDVNHFLRTINYPFIFPYLHPRWVVIAWISRNYKVDLDLASSIYFTHNSSSKFLQSKEKKSVLANIDNLKFKIEKMKFFTNNNELINDWDNYSTFIKIMIKITWRLSLRFINFVSYESRYVDIVDRFIMKYYVNDSVPGTCKEIPLPTNLISKMNSFENIVTEHDKKERSIKITFDNTHRYHRKLLYVHLWYAIISHKDFKNIPLKVFISTGINDSKEKNYSLHTNFLYGANKKLKISLKKFLTHIQPNLIHLLTEPYFDDPCDHVIVQIYDVSPNSSYLLDIQNKGRTYEDSKLLRMVKDYSIKIGRGNVAVRSPQGKKNIRKYSTKASEYDFTILKKKIKNKVKGIIAVDIETMKFEGQTKQLPVLLSLAYYKGISNEQVTKVFLININLVESKGYDHAAKIMWTDFYYYLKINVNPKNYTIFTHNLGAFDGFFIYFNLLKHSTNISDDNCIVDKENKFIQITTNLNGTNGNYVFKDSMRIFPVGLEEFCEAFAIEGKLTPYRTEWNSFNLFKEINKKEYDHFLKYSLQDSIGLLEVLTKTQQIYNDNYKVDICSIWSTATLSMKIFRQSFLKETIPSLNKYLDSYIRSGYFGGATDHYKMYGENLHHYDVNSLYPYVMLKDMPLKHIKFHSSIKNIDKFFGFCLAKIKCDKNIHIPVLPYRNEDNTVVYPYGSWVGVYFSEQLKSAIRYGYKVEIINGHEFSRAKIFNDYIHHFYNIKKKSKGGLRFIAKMQLNQLYGYFGRSRELIMTQNVNRADLSSVLISRVVSNVIKIDDDKYIVLMQSNLNKGNLNDLDLEFETKNLKSINKKIKSNVAISAAVTAYAQSEMMKYKVKYSKNLYYSDTDSIFLDIALPDDLVGNEIGQMKDELIKKETKIIDKALFLGNKQYGYTFTNNEGQCTENSVWSGAKENSITWAEMIAISKGEMVPKTYESKFYRNFSKLQIDIKERKITLNNKESNCKKVKNNNYISPYVYNKSHKFLISQENFMTKIINKWSYLISVYYNL